MQGQLHEFPEHERVAKTPRSRSPLIHDDDVAKIEDVFQRKFEEVSESCER